MPSPTRRQVEGIKDQTLQGQSTVNGGPIHNFNSQSHQHHTRQLSQKEPSELMNMPIKGSQTAKKVYKAKQPVSTGRKINTKMTTIHGQSSRKGGGEPTVETAGVMTIKRSDFVDAKSYKTNHNFTPKPLNINEEPQAPTTTTNSTLCQQTFLDHQLKDELQLRRQSYGNNTFLQEPKPLALNQNLVPQPLPERLQSGIRSSQLVETSSQFLVPQCQDSSSGILGGQPITTSQVDNRFSLNSLLKGDLKQPGEHDSQLDVNSLLLRHPYQSSSQLIRPSSKPQSKNSRHAHQYDSKLIASDLQLTSMISSEGHQQEAHVLDKIRAKLSQAQDLRVGGPNEGRMQQPSDLQKVDNMETVPESIPDKIEDGEANFILDNSARHELSCISPSRNKHLRSTSSFHNTNKMGSARLGTDINSSANLTHRFASNKVQNRTTDMRLKSLLKQGDGGAGGGATNNVSSDQNLKSTGRLSRPLCLSSRQEIMTYQSQTPSNKNGAFRITDTLYSAECRENCCAGLATPQHGKLTPFMTATARHEDDLQRQQTLQVVETEVSHLPSNQINSLKLKFGASMQTFISPTARAEKKVMQEHQYSSVLWKLQNTLHETNSSDILAKRELQKSIKALQTGQYSDEVVQDFLTKSNLMTTRQPISAGLKNFHPQQQLHTTRKQFSQQDKKDDNEEDNEVELESDQWGFANNDDDDGDLSSIGDVSGSVRFSTNEKKLASRSGGVDGEKLHAISDSNDDEDEEIRMADNLGSEDEFELEQTHKDVFNRGLSAAGPAPHVVNEQQRILLPDKDDGSSSLLKTKYFQATDKDLQPYTPGVVKDDSSMLLGGINIGLLSSESKTHQQPQQQHQVLDSFATPDLPDEIEYQFNGDNALAKIKKAEEDGLVALIKENNDRKSQHQRDNTIPQESEGIQLVDLADLPSRDQKKSQSQQCQSIKGPQAPFRITNKLLQLESPSISETPKGDNSVSSPSPSNSNTAKSHRFSHEEMATKQFVKVDTKVKMPLGMQSHQRRLGGAMLNRRAPAAGAGAGARAAGIEKWQRIETDALTIPTESNCEYESSSYLHPVMQTNSVSSQHTYNGKLQQQNQRTYTAASAAPKTKAEKFAHGTGQVSKSSLSNKHGRSMPMAAVDLRQMSRVANSSQSNNNINTNLIRTPKSTKAGYLNQSLSSRVKTKEALDTRSYASSTSSISRNGVAYGPPNHLQESSSSVIIQAQNSSHIFPPGQSPTAINNSFTKSNGTANAEAGTGAGRGFLGGSGGVKVLGFRSSSQRMGNTLSTNPVVASAYADVSNDYHRDLRSKMQNRHRNIYH